MRGWRWRCLAAGASVVAFMSTTTLAQRQFQFFAHFTDAAGKPVAGVTETDISVTEDNAEGKVLSARADRLARPGRLARSTTAPAPRIG